jgi:hypothetical protein
MSWKKKSDFGFHRFELEASGHASTEEQLNHAMAALRVKDREIATLKLKLETQKIQHDLTMNEIERKLNAMTMLRDIHMLRANESPPRLEPLAKKRWWKFW